MKIWILDEAKRDLINGFLFYEKQAKGLGDYFLDALYSDIDSLQIYAGVHSLHFSYYRMLSRRFPYAIYYQLEEEVIKVIAVLDCRRDPLKLSANFK